MNRKSKLVKVDDELWKLLTVFAKWKDMDLPDALEFILSKHLLPFKEALEEIEK